MKRFSKIFSVFLMMVMILTSIPTNVFASNITRRTDTIIENDYIDYGNVVNNNLEDDLVVIREESTQYGKIYHVLHKSQLQNKNLWDVADVVMAGISWAEFLGDPSMKNFAWATLDTVAILPFLPSTAYFRQGGKTIIKAKELAKFAKTSKGSKVIKTAIKTKKLAKPIFKSTQLQKKFKHAVDFGIKGNYSKAKALEFEKALKNVINGASEIYKSQYHGDVIVYIKNGLGVITDLNGNFISGWKFNSSQLKFHRSKMRIK